MWRFARWVVSCGGPHELLLALRARSVSVRLGQGKGGADDVEGGAGVVDDDLDASTPVSRVSAPERSSTGSADSFLETLAQRFASGFVANANLPHHRVGPLSRCHHALVVVLLASRDAVCRWLRKARGRCTGGRENRLRQKVTRAFQPVIQCQPPRPNHGGWRRSAAPCQSRAHSAIPKVRPMAWAKP